MALTNNSLITTASAHHNVVPDFRCLSGSSDPNAGRIIDPSGTDITFLTSSPFVITFVPSGTILVHNLMWLNSSNMGIIPSAHQMRKGKLSIFLTLASISMTTPVIALVDASYKVDSHKIWS